MRMQGDLWGGCATHGQPQDAGVAALWAVALCEWPIEATDAAANGCIERVQAQDAFFAQKVFSLVR